jgi:murein DD-endopeptidase MepM/ murein hydrolase activator NlpD
VRRIIAVLVVVIAFVPIGSARGWTFDPIAPVDGPIVRHFEKPATPYSAGHRGIDFGCPFGSPVVAVADGTIAFAGPVGGALFVSIDHPNGLRSTYSYLSVVLVKKGVTVKQGQVVARSGQGDPGSTQPVLHFGIRSGSDYLDPEAILLAAIRRNLWRVVGLAP